jgi:hypothetical protein
MIALMGGKGGNRLNIIIKKYIYRILSSIEI